MKRLFKIAFAIILSLIFFNCSNDNELIKDVNSELLSSKEIEKIAQEHNQTLNFVLNTLKSKDLSKVNDVEKMISILDEGTENYFITILKNENQINKAVQLSSKEISKYLKPSESISSKRTNSSPISQVIEENQNYFNDEQITLLQQCDQVLNNFNGNNIEIVTNSLEKIKSRAQSELLEENAQIILIACEIGIMSSTYWSENIEEWNQVLNGNSSSRIASKSWFSWSEVAGADVAGAVGAAVTTAIINVVPGAGPVGYGTAIVSTAAGASAGDAVLQVWNYMFE